MENDKHDQGFWSEGGDWTTGANDDLLCRRDWVAPSQSSGSLQGDIKKQCFKTFGRQLLDVTSCAN
jgi:hypothetical protein